MGFERLQSHKRSAQRADEWLSVSLSVGCHQRGAYGVSLQREWSTRTQKNTLMIIYFAAGNSIKYHIWEHRSTSVIFLKTSVHSVQQLVSVVWGNFKRCFGSFTVLMTVRYLLTFTRCSTQVDQHHFFFCRLHGAQHVLFSTETNTNLERKHQRLATILTCL